MNKNNNLRYHDPVAGKKVEEKIDMLLEGYLSGELDEQQRNATFQQVFFDNVKSGAASAQARRRLGKLHKKLSFPTHRQGSRAVPLHRRMAFRVAAAVIPLLVAGAALYLTLTEKDAVAQHPQILTITALPGEQDKVMLPDGSSVVLQPGATLAFDDKFTGGRHVTLTGEALFDVAKLMDGAGNPLPFSVTADQLTVNVHGTVFRVKDSTDATEGVVALYQGSVSVDAGDTTTVLERGEELNFNKGTGICCVSLIPAGDMADNGFMPLLRFDMSSLGNLITSLKTNYGIEFDIPKGADLSKGAFSGDFRNETLESTLNILTRSNITYAFTLAGDRVVVTKK